MNSFVPKLPLVTIFVGAAILYVSGIYLTWVAYSQYSTPPYVCSSTVCWATTILGLGGLGLVLLGLRALWRALIHAGYIRFRRPASSPQTGSGPEDQKILAIGREAFGRAKQRRRRPLDAFYWSEDSAWY